MPCAGLCFLWMNEFTSEASFSVLTSSLSLLSISFFLRPFPSFVAQAEFLSEFDFRESISAEQLDLHKFQYRIACAPNCLWEFPCAEVMSKKTTEICLPMRQIRRLIAIFVGQFIFEEPNLKRGFPMQANHASGGFETKFAFYANERRLYTPDRIYS